MKKVIIASLVGLCGCVILISGYINESGKQDVVVIDKISTNQIEGQNSNNTTTTSTIATTKKKTTKKAVKTTKKTTTKKTYTTGGFNVKASKSEMQQYARSILSEKDYEALDYIITHESGWNANNVNKKSGASGLCQSLPASKMAISGKDYKTNYKTQINWCILYCNTRYGSIQKAKQFWLKHHWF